MSRMSRIHEGEYKLRISMNKRNYSLKSYNVKLTYFENYLFYVLLRFG